jgi:ribosomal protein S18 acetylase RimI-like enzyme
MSTVRIRPIAGADWDRIADLEARAYTPLGLSEGRAALRSRARVSPATCFVLDVPGDADSPNSPDDVPATDGDGRSLAGYLLALPYPAHHHPDLAVPERTPYLSRNLHLHDLVIAEDLRRRGLASRLLGHLLATARPRGYETVSLVAVAGTVPFWTAGGFTAAPGTAPPEGYGPGAVHLTRRIAAAPDGTPAPAPTLAPAPAPAPALSGTPRQPLGGPVFASPSQQEVG